MEHVLTYTEILGGLLVLVKCVYPSPPVRIPSGLGCSTEYSLTNLEILSLRPSEFALSISAVLCLGIMVDFLTRIAIRTESSEWVRYPTPGRRLGTMREPVIF